MDPWQIVGYLFLGIIQLIAMACVYFISRQGKGEQVQGSQRETIATLSEKYSAVRRDVDTLTREHDSSRTTLSDENSRVKDQLAGLSGQFTAFVAESRGQLSAINDKLALRDDRLAAIDDTLRQMGTAMKDMSVQIATLYERSKNTGGPANGDNRSLTEAERRVVALLRQVVRDEG